MPVSRKRHGARNDGTGDAVCSAARCTVQDTADQCRERVKAACLGGIGALVGTGLAALVTLQIPELRYGGAMAGAIVGGSIGLGAALGLAAGRALAGGKRPIGADLPDFGELVAKRFADHVSGELPNWPTATLADSLLQEGWVSTAPTVIALRVGEIKLTSYYGLTIVLTAQMICFPGGRVWQKTCRYSSRTFNRRRSLSEYEANDYRLLKEELELAADAIVAEIVWSLKTR